MKAAVFQKVKLTVAAVICAVLVYLPVSEAFAAPKDKDPDAIATTDRSDLNGDGKVDFDDLVIFSVKFLEQNVDDVEWCKFYETVAQGGRIYGKLTTYFQKHFRTLLGVINDIYGCEGGPLLLTVVNEPKYFARIAIDAQYTGNYYITDPIVGSVFIYDPAWNLIGELKNLAAKARENGLFFAVAGQLKATDLPRLRLVFPDIVAIRSAACAFADRGNAIDTDAVSRFKHQMAIHWPNVNAF